MSRALYLFALVVVAAPLTTVIAQDRGGVYRDGQPDGSFERPGQPETMSAPREWGGGDMSSARFAATYAKLRSPRIVVFWNRELTDDLETEREDVTQFSADSYGSASSHQQDYRTRRTSNSDIDSTNNGSLQGEVRSSTRRVDPGKRATPLSEADDFDTERGFIDGLTGAGARLVDRTAIMRASALGANASNAQAVEMRALMARAEWTIEVTPLSDNGDGARYKMIVRNISTGTIVAMTTSDGTSAPKRMPYVAGPNGFVRATPTSPGAEERGRQLASDVMASIAGRSR
jgi:hypothetical protein